MFATGLHADNSQDTFFNGFHPNYPGIVFAKDICKKRFNSYGGKVVGTGIQLHILKGAIPEGTSVKVSIQPCIGGQFSLSSAYKFISPVYLVQPPFQFKKNETLEIELFTGEINDNLIFVTSPCKPTTENNCAVWEFSF